MSAEYVRSYYGVPAKRGMRVRVQGQLGTIVGFQGQYLRVRRDGEKQVRSYHPTWEVEYQPDESGAP